MLKKILQFSFKTKKIDLICDTEILKQRLSLYKINNYKYRYFFEELIIFLRSNEGIITDSNLKNDIACDLSLSTKYRYLNIFHDRKIIYLPNREKPSKDTSNRKIMILILWADLLYEIRR